MSAQPLAAASQLYIVPNSLQPAQPLPVSPPPQQADKSDEFWEIWLQHRDYVYRVCLKCTSSNQTEANELLSQARDKAQAKWAKHAHKVTNPKSWLSSLTKHLYIDLYRARERQNKVHAGLQKEALGAISYQPTPEANLLKNELMEYLSQLTSDLPTRLREPFILRFYQEKSYKEVAFQLGITEATGRKRIQQARTLLRKQVTRYLAGESDAKISTAMHDETLYAPNGHPPLFHN